MIEVTKKAANYAAEKANKVMIDAIAQAYADGYRAGYKDREEEIPVDLRDNKTEYIDLGLPSGTLWATEYEMTKNEEGEKELLFLPYGKAAKYSLPTEEQWNELLEVCKLRGEKSSSGITFYGLRCIGPNGNSVYFRSKGYMEDSRNVAIPDFGGGQVFFWLKDDSEGNEKKAIHVSNWKRENPMTNVIDKVFSGYKLPIRLVR